MIIRPFNITFNMMLLVSCIYFITLYLWGKNKSQDERKQMLLKCSIAVIVMFVIYKTLILFDPSYNAIRNAAGLPNTNFFQELPFNGCNVVMMLTPIAILTGNEYLLALCAVVGIVLPVFPLLTPEVGFEGYSILLPRIFGFYVTHILIIYNSILLWTYDLFKPTIKSAVKAVGASFCVITFDHVLNIILRVTQLGIGANYCFTMETEGNVILELFYRFIPIQGLYVMPLLIVLFIVALVELGVYTGLRRIKSK